MDDRVYELLEQADWPKLTKKLMGYAVRKIRSLGWLYGRNINSLPKSMSVEDIVYEAIVKVWEGERKWEPDRVPDLWFFLQEVVRSSINHLVESHDHKLMEELPDPLPEKNSYKLIGDAENRRRPVEEIYIEEESHKDTQKKMLAAVNGDKDLELVMIYILTNKTMVPREIARETGIDVKRVYKLKEKVKEISRNVHPEYGAEKISSEGRLSQ